MLTQDCSIAFFRFYGGLNFFLPEYRKGKIFEYEFKGKPSLRNVIEGIGIPHTEPGLIIVNGKSSSFDYQLSNKDFISVYPVFKNIDISSVSKLKKILPEKIAFILDVHLGTLARLLRLLGFNALYRNDYDDPDIVKISVRENRIILTRDRRLLYAKSVKYGYIPRSQNPELQLIEILEHFDLYDRINPFTRCISCNGLVESVDKKDIIQYLEPKTKKYYNEFTRCCVCSKIFWKGSHFSRLNSFVDKCRNA